jgi:hypothetical protein
MKKYILLIAYILLLFPVRADEGMWIPMLLDQTRYNRMVELGCKLSPEDIYSINHASLKDAVVLFDRGCSGVLVSNEGLLFTNHHCGYGAIQSHSSLEHNYLADGFIANSRSEELPNPSITVSFLVKMEDVTGKILNNVSADLTEWDRQLKIQENISNVIAEASNGSPNKFVIKPQYNNNQYFIYEYEVFTDVRLVAAPPSNIGKFGGDTDNWVWPRHTGDFSVFRIYADKNNKPAPYSPDNVPYKPKKFVPVSIKGIEENDFTMVYGFPAVTDEYLNSKEVDLMVNLQLPQKVALRSIRLGIMREEMEADPLTKIKYAAKYAGTSNAWKKWDGMIKGLNAANAVSKKMALEKSFNEWVMQDEVRKIKYGNLFNAFDNNFEVFKKYALVVDYYNEAVLAVEILSQSSRLYTFINKNSLLPDSGFRAELKKYGKGMESYYINYSPSIDKKTLVQLLMQYRKNIATEYHPALYSIIDTKFKGDFNLWADYVFEKSILSSQEKFSSFISKWNKKSKEKVLNDPAVSAFLSFLTVVAGKVGDPYNKSILKSDSIYRIYMQGLQEFQSNKILYPDANQTLRISYGKVQGYSPEDAVKYKYYTTVDGIIEKQDSTISDYIVSPKLLEIWKKKDYGQYADSSGKLRVCFIASNHTSGGNSGSPVFNANGELIGLNFDRCWEGTMSDIYYDPALCRNIVLDSRYLLFVLEKISGAKHLINELQIVK